MASVPTGTVKCAVERLSRFNVATLWFFDGIAVDSIQEEQSTTKKVTGSLAVTMSIVSLTVLDWPFCLLLTTKFATLSASAHSRSGQRTVDKNLFIDSQRERKEFIVQTNYNFSLTDNQSARVGLNAPSTNWTLPCLLPARSGLNPSDQFGGLSLINFCFKYRHSRGEERYEGFVFHNWTINDKSSSSPAWFMKPRSFSDWRGKQEEISVLALWTIATTLPTTSVFAARFVGMFPS